jgi:uncharacterized phiE125 gp8 family phage protein
MIEPVLWWDRLPLKTILAMHKTEHVDGPDVELITLDEAKEHLRFRSDSKNDEITRMIKAIRQSIERYLKRALITQEWKVYYNCWASELKIPFGNLQLRAASEDPVVEKRPLIKYYDLEGDLTTLDESVYYWIDNKSDPAKIIRKYDATYPELQYGRPNAIEITFLCGYGDDPEDVPEDIIHALKVMLTNYFENPGSVVVGNVVNEIPGHIKNLLHDYRLYDF